MRALLIFTMLLLLLTSCVYTQKLMQFIGMPSQQNPSPVATTKQCGADVQCIETNMQLCSKATGTVTSDGKTGDIEVLQSINGDCMFKYTITSSTDSSLQGKTLTCTIPNNNQNYDINYLLGDEAGYCAGKYTSDTWITFITPGFLTNENITVQNDMLVFNLQNQYPDIYINDLNITGPYFSNCYVRFGRPYAIRGNESKEFTLSCDKIDTQYDYLPGKIRINTTASGQERILQGYFSAKVI